MKKVIKLFLAGMNMDNQVLKYMNDGYLMYAVKNKNIKLNAQDQKNERIAISSVNAPKKETEIGEYALLGSAEIDNYICLFLANKTESNLSVYKISNESLELIGKLENLGFESLVKDNLIPSRTVESIILKDSEKKIILYWADGINQLRRVNILDLSSFTPEASNILPEINSECFGITPTIERRRGGFFLNGTTQFCISFYRHNTETNLVYYSPLYYNTVYSYKGVPDDYDGEGVSYKISYKLSADIFTNYDGIYIYSIYKAGKNGEPIVKKLRVNKPTERSGNYIFEAIMNNSQDNVATPVFNRCKIIPQTITHKDNTIFLGNIKQIYNKTDKDVVSSMSDKLDKVSTTKTLGTKTYEYINVKNDGSASSSMNTKKCPLSSNSYSISHFKYRERYMLGVQFCDKYGYWSDAIQIGQKEMDLTPDIYSDDKTIIDAYFYTILKKNEDNIPKDAVAVRPVIIFPEGSERKVLAQGVINPTIFDCLNPNDIYSSEFYRPIIELGEGKHLCIQPLMNDSSWPLSAADKLKDPVHQYCESGGYWNGTYVEFRNEYQCGFGNTTNCEFQSNVWPVENFNGTSGKSSTIKVNSNLCTIDLIDDVSISDSINLSFVGKSFYDYSASKMSINATAGYFMYGGKDDESYSSGGNQIETSIVLSGANAGRTIVAFPNWNAQTNFMQENDWATGSDKWQNPEIAQTYLVYPFSREFLSFAKLPAEDNEDERTDSKLNYKILSHYRATNHTNYAKLDKIKTIQSANGKMVDLDASGCTIDNYNFYRAINFVPVVNFAYHTRHDAGYDILNKAQGWRNGSYVYSCTINVRDEVIEPSFPVFNMIAYNHYDTDVANANKWRVYPVAADNSVPDYQLSFPTGYSELGVYAYDIPNGHYRVKSMVVETKYNTPKSVIVRLPDDNTIEDYRDLNITNTGAYQMIVDIDSSSSNDIYVSSSRSWIIAGETTVISDGDIEVKWLQGDWYYNRVDFLRCSPTSIEDKNQVIEIGSFMLETRVNASGRYDNYIGECPLAINDQKYNKVNPAYTQLPNYYMAYSNYLNDSFDNDEICNGIAFSLARTAGADIDEWTNVTTASMAESDPSLGTIVTLDRYKDTIIGLQQYGAFEVLFNSRTQISTEGGVPIEIANSGKVDGIRYLTRDYGIVNNKNYIVANDVIYFLDYKTSDIFSSNMAEFKNLSFLSGMQSWSNTLSSDTAFYFNSNDAHVYIVDQASDSKETMAYNVNLASFESFYDYNIMMGYTNSYRLMFSQEEGKLNSYTIEAGDSVLPFNVDFVMNGDTTMDKTFDYISFNAENINSGKFDNDIADSNMPIDRFRVFNNYADTGLLSLSTSPSVKSIMKKKFSTWNLQIPKDQNRKQGYVGNRIHGTWAEFYLGKEDTSRNNKTIINDIYITYWEL